MKNLSKALALVLAVVMIVGVFSIGVSADFKDVADISYDEAVGVLSTLKVLEGYEDGSFKPEGEVTRAEAAAIICRLLLGRDLADSLKTEAKPFNDVEANNWAAGYIAYCAQEDIIAGYGDGNFYPAEKVTGYQIAKMILVAIGIDPEEYGLVGANWQLNTAKLAVQGGIFDGNLGADYTKPATREETALYGFNGMFIGTEVVTETATKYVLTSTGTKDALDTWSGTLYPTFQAAKNAADAATEGAAVYGKDYTITSMSIVSETVVGSLADKVFNLSKDTRAADAYGRPSNAYTQGSKDIFASVKAPVLTYTTPVLGKQIYADLGLTKPIEPEMACNKAKPDEAVYKISASSDYLFGGQGVTTEVYKMGEGYRVVEIEEYFSYVKSVKTATVPLTGKKVTTLTLKNDLTTTEFTDFAKGDAVLYTVSHEDDHVILSMKKAEAVTGAVSKITSKNGVPTYTIGGAAYKVSKNADEFNTEIGTFYLDSCGNLIAVKAANGPTVNFLYGIMQDGRQQSAKDASWSKNTAAVEAYEQVKILTDKGEVEIFDTAWEPATEEEENESFIFEQNGNVAADYTGLVKYTLTDDGKVDSIVGVTDAGKVDKVELKKNDPDFGEVTATAATLYFLKADKTTQVFTGYANVPTKEVTKVEFFASEDGVIVAAYGTVDSFGVESAPDYVFFGSGDCTIETEKVGGKAPTTVYTYTDVYVNGEKTELKFAAAQSNVAGKLYTFTVNSKTGLATLGEKNLLADWDEVKLIDAGYFKTDADTNNIVFVDSKTVYVEVAELDEDVFSVEIVDGLPGLKTLEDQVLKVGFVDGGKTADKPAAVVYFAVKAEEN